MREKTGKMPSLIFIVSSVVSTKGIDRSMGIGKIRANIALGGAEFCMPQKKKAQEKDGGYYSSVCASKLNCDYITAHPNVGAIRPAVPEKS